MKTKDNNTHLEEFNSLFIRINLGTFSPSEERPCILSVQNKVNSVLLEGDISNFHGYKRIELTENENTENEKTAVELFFLYQYNKGIPESLSDRIKKLSKILKASINSILIKEEECNIFSNILDEYDDELDDEHMLRAKNFADELEKKYQTI